MLEPLGWNGEVTDGRNDVSCDFCPLALLALSGPLGNVLAYRRPHELGTDGLTSSFYARMAETVDRVEYSASPRVRNERPSWTIGDVNENFGLTQVDLFE